MAPVARAAGVLPVLAAIVAAAALAGAAVFTVSQASCSNPGHYVQDGTTTAVVGGCLRRDELPGTNQEPAQAAERGTGFSQSRP